MCKYRYLILILLNGERDRTESGTESQNFVMSQMCSLTVYRIKFRIRSARMSVEFGIKIGLDCKDDWTRAARIDDMAVSQ